MAALRASCRLTAASCNSAARLTTTMCTQRSLRPFCTPTTPVQKRVSEDSGIPMLDGPPPGKAAEGRDIWLPHDLLPVGSPIFYVALVVVPVLVWYNERMDAQEDVENRKLREERLRRRAAKELEQNKDNT
eukprot:gnl/TRDRNA2_/TRDRNA2_197149_c0_seq1.p1 gnl/TRDRNA2_/TRDRNA2_197149_c0~~gnl/TRDRNA2_/TRDRNA2_197149_c0_seq1.p1  ORF type:complete len:131 (+),score=18.96 gnl/TRDRNA2_/TRDRNA2_197149_c0_seq1:93-485(+)